MNKKQLTAKANRFIGKTKFMVKKNSPEILIAVGVVGVVATVVTACRATTKLNDILEETHDALEEIHSIKVEDSESEAVVKKSTTKIYAYTGLRLVRLYAPAAVLGVASITCILASHNILKKRNLAISAAYAALEKSFQTYEQRVIDRFGEDVAREIKYGITKEKVEEQQTDPETGKTKKTKKEIEVLDGKTASPYARFFDELSRYHDPYDLENNLFFLRAEQNYANARLKNRGYLFLNEVYERLGIPTTKEGQCVGWYYNPEHPELEKDNFVDFGIYTGYTKKKSEFINGTEPAILLDFNVHYIMDKFEANQRQF